MKNVAVVSTLFMLAGSALAGPLNRRHVHHPRRRDVTTRYVTDCKTVYTTVYYTTTTYVSSYETAGPNRIAQDDASLSPSEKPAAEHEDAPAPSPAAAAPVAPATTPAPSPKEEGGSLTSAEIQAQHNKDQEEYIKMQEETNKEQEEANKKQEEINNSGAPPTQETKNTPPPSQPDASSGDSGSTGGKRPTGFADDPEFKHGKVNSGEATFYNTGLGSCGITSNDDELVVAISKEFYDLYTPLVQGLPNPNKNSLCGLKLKASLGGKSVTVTVVDRCPGCKGRYDLDMSPAAFRELASEATGRCDIEWKWAN